MSLDNLVGKGLEITVTDAEEVARYMAMIEAKLKDSKNASNSLVSRFDLAFESLLQVAVLALRANGYRTDSQAGDQQLAIQTLPKSVGIDAAEVRTLEEYRKKRSAGLYGADYSPTEEEVKSVIRSADALRGKVLDWIKENRRELMQQKSRESAKTRRKPGV
jgi:hypothetical protein